MQLREAADVLGVHYQTAYGWVRRGVLPARKTAHGYEVTDGDVSALAERRASGTAPPPQIRVRDWSAQADRLHAAIVSGDETAARQIFGRLARGVAITDLCERVIAPALNRIGADWAAGALNIATEHRASAICERLIAARARQPQGRPRGVAVTATPPGERHALPALMATVCLREDRWLVHHLAADLPVAEVIRLALDTGAALVVLSAATAEGGRLARQAVQEITLAIPGICVLAGRPGQSLSQLRQSARAIAVDTSRLPADEPARGPARPAAGLLPHWLAVTSVTSSWPGKILGLSLGFVSGFVWGIMGRFISAVALYGPKTGAVRDLLAGVQAVIAAHLGDRFLPYSPDQIHATLIALNAVPDPRAGTVVNEYYLTQRDRAVEMDLPRVMDTLEARFARPLRVRIGGWRQAGEIPFTSQGQHLFDRAFSAQGHAFVLVGWPVRSRAGEGGAGRAGRAGGVARPVDDLRRDMNAAGLLHKYHARDTDVDNDLHLVVGHQAGAAAGGGVDRAVAAVRERLAADPVEFAIGLGDVKIVAADSHTLAPPLYVSDIPADEAILRTLMR
jgi:methanogenic corrinoid protein MtbC1